MLAPILVAGGSSLRIIGPPKMAASGQANAAMLRHMFSTNRGSTTTSSSVDRIYSPLWRDRSRGSAHAIFRAAAQAPAAPTGVRDIRRHQWYYTPPATLPIIKPVSSGPSALSPSSDQPEAVVDPGWLKAYVEALRRWPEAAIFGGPIIRRF